MFGHLDSSFDRDKNFRKYQCSLCHALAKNYGNISRFLTNYDMSLLLLIATAHIKNEITIKKRICPIFVSEKIYDPERPLLKYIAAITILLVSEKIKDDIHDEGKRFPKIALKWIKKKEQKAKKILNDMSFDYSIIKKSFEFQRSLENIDSVSLLQLAQPTASVMSEIYAFSTIINNSLEDRSALKKIGHSLGIIIYLIDNLQDFKKDMLTNTFNPLHKCFSPDYQNYNSSISSKANEEVILILKHCQKDIENSLKELAEDQYLKDILTTRLKIKIESYIKSPNIPIQSDKLSLLDKIRRITPLSVLSSPGIVFASNGEEGGSSCYGSLTFLIIMLIAYALICRGCCGNICSPRPDRVTVDHGCAGRRTYRRDSCSGRYRDDRCC